MHDKKRDRTYKANRVPAIALGVGIGTAQSQWIVKNKASGFETNPMAHFVGSVLRLGPRPEQIPSFVATISYLRF
jgi:hypothetical protein